MHKNYFLLPCLAVANKAGAGTSNLSSTRHQVVSNGGGNTTSEISHDSTTWTAATTKERSNKSEFLYFHTSEVT